MMWAFHAKLLRSSNLVSWGSAWGGGGGGVWRSCILPESLFLKVLQANWAQKTIFRTQCLSTRITCLLCLKAVYNLDGSCEKHLAILQNKFSIFTQLLIKMD